jgi:hypothetical protein
MLINFNRSSNLRALRQPVNMGLCIAFIGVLCFWFALYYFTEKAKAMAELITIEGISQMR